MLRDLEHIDRAALEDGDSFRRIIVISGTTSLCRLITATIRIAIKLVITAKICHSLSSRGLELAHGRRAHWSGWCLYVLTRVC